MLKLRALPLLNSTIDSKFVPAHYPKLAIESIILVRQICGCPIWTIWTLFGLRVSRLAEFESIAAPKFNCRFWIRACALAKSRHWSDNLGQTNLWVSNLASNLAIQFGYLAIWLFISILLSGTDSSGQPVHAAKVITLVGEDIYNLNWWGDTSTSN